MVMNFETEEIKCSHQRNISKAVTKQQFEECTYLNNFRGTLRPRGSHMGASQKKDHSLRVVPLLRLVHTNKRCKHVSRSTLRLTAFADTDLSRFVTSAIALHLSQFCAAYFPTIASIVFRDPSMQ